VFTDYVLNGTGFGEVGQHLAGSQFQPNLLRPYLDENNVPCVTANMARPSSPARYEKVPIAEMQRRGTVSPVYNAATMLRKEEWLLLDQVVLRAARYRLRAWLDLAGSNTFGGFNGMSKMILEHEMMSDPGEAIVDMDALTPGRTDSPQFQLQGIPLPITHSDFWFSSRLLSISRNTGTPLDVQQGEAAARRVAEAIEKTTIGNQLGTLYGGFSTYIGGYAGPSQVWGYTNFPNRITTNIVAPTTAGWVAGDLLDEVLMCRDLLYANKFYGPFMIYHSNDWDRYLDNDYILTGGNVATQTLRDRLRAIEGIQDVRRLDFLFSIIPPPTTGPGGENVTQGYPFTLLFVQMTPDVARAINGMDITTVQWESIGGMRLNFKVLCIQVPQLRRDFYGNCGILHATGV